MTEFNILNSHINNKFCFFDEEDLDNCIIDINTIKISELTKPFYKKIPLLYSIIDTLLNIDNYELCNILHNYNFSREKILLYILFDFRMIVLIDKLLNKNYLDKNSINLDSKNNSYYLDIFKTIFIFNGDKDIINHDFDLKNLHLNKNYLYSIISLNRSIDISEKNMEDLCMEIRHLLIKELEMKELLSNNNEFKTSLTNIILCLKYFNIMLNNYLIFTYVNLINNNKSNKNESTYKIKEEFTDILLNDSDFNNYYNTFYVNKEKLKTEIKNNFKIYTVFKNNKDLAINMYNYFYKLSNMHFLIYQAFNVKDTDLFNLNVYKNLDIVGPWRIIEKYRNICEISSKKEIFKKLERLYYFINLAISAEHKSFTKTNIKNIISIENSFKTKKKSFIKKKLLTAFYMNYYFFNKTQKNRSLIHFNSNSYVNVSKNTWNLLDSKLMKLILKAVIPKIKSSEYYFIKKNLYYKELTFDYLNQLNSFIQSINHSSINKNNEYNNNYYTKLNKIDNNKNKSIFEENNEFCEINKQSFITEKDYKLTKKKNKDASKSIRNCFVKVKVLLNCNKLNLIKSKHDNKNICDIDTIVIQIHGGGFIAMSPDSHEIYLRKWANGILNPNKSKVPIFCIKYRKSPKYPYPKAIDDVYQAYCAIVKNYVSNLNILNLKKVILIGDSAGGIITCGLLNVIISKNISYMEMNNINSIIRIPDNLYLIYPGLRSKLEYFTPSRLLTLKDNILSMNFLKLVVDAYSGGKDISNDNIFFNPIITTDKVMPYFVNYKNYYNIY